MRLTEITTWILLACLLATTACNVAVMEKRLFGLTATYAEVPKPDGVPLESFSSMTTRMHRVDNRNLLDDDKLYLNLITQASIIHQKPYSGFYYETCRRTFTQLLGLGGAMTKMLEFKEWVENGETYQLRVVIMFAQLNVVNGKILYNMRSIEGNATAEFNREDVFTPRMQGKSPLTTMNAALIGEFTYRSTFIAMLEKLKQETGLGSSFDYLGFEPGSEDYIKESLILKHLLPQSTYFVTENIANKFQIGKDIVTSTGDTLGIDQSTLNRMTAVATSHPYSNFLLVPNAKTIIFVTMAHKDDIEYAFTTRKYTAEGASLPVGVFATGSKNWNLEKPGQHASISASDLMKVFIPLL